MTFTAFLNTALPYSQFVRLFKTPQTFLSALGIYNKINVNLWLLFMAVKINN